MSDRFNPFEEWLGLPPGELSPNYYRLFGLDDFETDSEKIATAAEVVRLALREVSPGEHFAAWKELLGEMDTAEQCLANPVAKAAYDSALRLAPRHDAPSAHVVSGDQPAVNGSLPPQLSELPDAISHRTRRGRRRSIWSVVWKLSAIGAVGTLGVAAILHFGGIPQRDSVTDSLPKDPAISEHNGQPEDAPTTNADDLPPGIGEADENEELVSRFTSSTDESSKLEPATTKSAVVKSPERADRVPNTAGDRAFRAAIDEVIRLLGARRLEDAEASITAAKQLAVTADQGSQIRAIQMLHIAVSNFWAAVHDSLRRMSAGQEFEHKGLKVIVVESTREKLVVRAKGKNYAFDPDNLKPGLARTLAALWIDADDPIPSMNVGAFLFVDPKGDRKEVAALWRKAAGRGQDVNLLLQLLER